MQSSVDYTLFHYLSLSLSDPFEFETKPSSH